MEVKKTSRKHGKYPFHIENLDPRVRPLVLALNDKGYKTLSSCAGHKSDKGGYVFIKGKKRKSRLEAFLKDFGLKEFGIQYDSQEATTVRFPRMGGSKGGRIIPKLELVIPDEGRVIISRLFRRNLHRIGIPVASEQSRLISYALSKALKGEELRKGELEW